jgi:hypothetical protein
MRYPEDWLIRQLLEVGAHLQFCRDPCRTTLATYKAITSAKAMSA